LKLELSLKLKSVNYFYLYDKLVNNIYLAAWPSDSATGMFTVLL